MYNIPHRLEDDADASFFINYGKSLVDAFPPITKEDHDRVNRTSTHMSTKYLENCEEVGLDHRDDDLRTDYVLYQAERVANKIGYVMLITMMAKLNMEPLNFDDIDHLHYILGFIGTRRVAELLVDILNVEEAQ